MGTKNISLPPELEGYIDAKVASGEFAHASEVVREGLRLMMKHEAEKLEWLKTAIAEGLAAVQRGDVVEADQAFYDDIKRTTKPRLSQRVERE